MADTNILSTFLGNNNAVKNIFEKITVKVRKKGFDTSFFNDYYLFFRAFFQFIIGTKASTKKRFETETRTNILVPKIGQDGDISEIFCQ